MQPDLKLISDKFNNLSMPNPVEQIINEHKVLLKHPYEFLIHNFPTFHEFFDYFVEVAPYYRGNISFSTVLHGIYYDLRDITIFVNAVNRGLIPPRIDRILKSTQTLIEMAQKKLTLHNTRLANEYKSKKEKNNK